MSIRPDRRKRVYIHRIQRKYAFLSLVPLVISSFLLVFFLFIPLDFVFLSSASPQAKQAALMHLRTLGVRVWPALFLAMIISGLLSVFVTHRLAGPIYRFGQVAHQVASGDLSIRVRLRKGDDLGDLQASMNQALIQLDAAVTDLKGQQGKLRTHVDLLSKQLEGAGMVSADVRETLEALIEDQAAIGEILARFKTQESATTA